MTAPLTVHRITPYDPADRDERGHYHGQVSDSSDCGPVEAAQLAAVRAFAEAHGVADLEIRDPEGYLVADPESYYDGLRLPLDTALELVRGMIREDGGLWCLLEADGFFVHVGHDRYVYVGTAGPVDAPVALAAALGLFPERIDASPYEPEPPTEPARPADDAFWRALPSAAPALLQQTWLSGASRWHRITPGPADALRAEMFPRAELAVWPDLLTTPEAALAALAGTDGAQVVWEQPDGSLAGRRAYREDHPELVPLLRAARTAAVLPQDARPLLAAVLPDADGVVRSRRRPDV
ncbi:RNA-binding protein [Kitasatospora sp. NPDC051914]|uniref:RNA-binding protein n=1 Tax=Kitasatospora sp. NPDC051914 TaxID=3154945 RepID=UPI00341FA00B